MPHRRGPGIRNPRVIAVPFRKLEKVNAGDEYPAVAHAGDEPVPGRNVRVLTSAQRHRARELAAKGLYFALYFGAALEVVPRLRLI